MQPKVIPGKKFCNKNTCEPLILLHFPFAGFSVDLDLFMAGLDGDVTVFFHFLLVIAMLDLVCFPLAALGGMSIIARVQVTRRVEVDPGAVVFPVKAAVHYLSAGTPDGIVS